MFFYRPKGITVGDTWYFQDGSKAHCIHMQNVLKGSGLPDEENGALGHATSTDLIAWKKEENALYRGQPGSYDDDDIWTGSVIRHEGVYYLYYTSRTAGQPGVNRISAATSEDGYHWKKYAGNPIITPDPRWYCTEEAPLKLHCHGWPIVDCRDLCVVKDEKRGGFWGFYAARQHAQTCSASSVIALCHSEDLLHWEQYPPCFVPNKYACIEVPEVFYMDGRWYMLCLTGNAYGKRHPFEDPNVSTIATIYAVADRLEGPYHEVTENILIGSAGAQGFCVKTLEMNGERYMFYTQRVFANGEEIKSVAIPKVLKTDQEGRLRPYYYRKLEEYLDQPIQCDPMRSLPHQGQWGSIGKWISDGGKTWGSCDADWTIRLVDIDAANGQISAEISIGTARGAGLVFHVPGDDISGGGYVVLADPQMQELIFARMRDFAKLEARKIRLAENQTFELKIVAIEGFVDIYMDEELMIQASAPQFTHGKFGLYVEDGAATFAKLSFWRLKDSAGYEIEAN